ncbi:CaiB/BaiF CoA transferase family protein [Nakamurella lactea]|uniref:CaiB/BaiF CoA transferase family protein n=1 Tax=Nakamurella lactea TaxID=459515 RepID=UPI000420AE94|nr:CaiB/BaiF CoA-transferase family protein [Nakamurella lactea]
MGSLPLRNLTVVSIEQAVSAPLATRHFADLGARVIKIERPGRGDFGRAYDDHVNGLATYFVWLNRGKESIELDTRSEQGRQALERLLTRSDIYVQNLGPGVAARYGLAAADVVARHPTVVAVDISGFGQDGPMSGRRAYDLVVQAETGSVAITGTPGAPAKPGIAVADIAVGMYAYSTVLAALLERAGTGRGTPISVSMFDAMADWMGYSLYYARYTGQDHRPYGVGHHAIVPYGAFETSDGQQLVLGCQNDGEWGRLCVELLHRPDLVDVPDHLGAKNRAEHREQIHGLVADAVQQLTLDEACTVLERAGVAHGRMNTPRELLTHPQLVDRGRWQEIGTEVGPVAALLPVPQVPGWSFRLGDVPALGAHTESVLRECGYSSAELQEWRSAGVIGSGPRGAE